MIIVVTTVIMMVAMLVIYNDVGGDVGDNDGDDNGGDDVPLANLMKTKQKSKAKKPKGKKKSKAKKKSKPNKYNFEAKRPFVPPQLPPFVPEPETPTPADRIPIEYVDMFLTDDMIENLVVESNKYATEKTGSCPNFTKAELRIYFGIYYLMGIVRLPKIDDYWRSDLRYGQIAEKMSRNRFRLIHRTLLFLYRRESKSLKNDKPLQMKEFQIQVATSLMCQGKVPRGRPSLQTPPPAKKHRVQPGPQLDIRYDNVGHLPMSQEKKGRCRFCPTGYSFWTCSKCKVYLCLVCGNNPKNCFAAYHMK